MKGGLMLEVRYDLQASASEKAVPYYCDSYPWGWNVDLTMGEVMVLSPVKDNGATVPTTN